MNDENSLGWSSDKVHKVLTTGFGKISKMPTGDRPFTQTLTVPKNSSGHGHLSLKA